MKNLINLTYSLDGVHIVQASNDRELGCFYADNGLIDALEDVPTQNQEAAFELLDYEKIGCRQRESEGGVYQNGAYVVRDSTELRKVYDGVHLPSQPQAPFYVFRLTLVSVADGSDVSSEELQGVLLDLPAGERDISTMLEKLGAKSLEDCMFTHCESPIPALDQAFLCSEDVGKLNELARRLRTLENAGELPKFKAALEIAGCKDVDAALNLTYRLDCYDLRPDLVSREEHDLQRFLEKHHIPADEPMLRGIRMVLSGFPKLENVLVYSTPYGIIRRVGPEQEQTPSKPEPQEGSELRIQ